MHLGFLTATFYNLAWLTLHKKKYPNKKTNKYGVAETLEHVASQHLLATPEDQWDLSAQKRAEIAVTRGRGQDIYGLRIAPDCPPRADCKITDCNRGWWNLKLPR